MPPKRKQAAATTDENAIKKQKTEQGPSDLALADEHVKGLVEVMSRLKNGDIDKLPEFRQQLADKDMEINKLGNQLNSAHAELQHEKTRRARAHDELQQTKHQVVKDLDAERTLFHESLKKLCDENQDLKKEIEEAKSDYEDLCFRYNETEEMYGYTSDLQVAAKRVTEMFEGMPVQDMGVLGESLKEMRTALGKIPRSLDLH